jgi:GTP-binding protein
MAPVHATRCLLALLPGLALGWSVHAAAASSRCRPPVAMADPAAPVPASPPAAAPAQKRTGGGKGGTRSRLPQIAVVGRPNVGKSTIANRLTKEFARGSLVFNQPGVTRDRTYGEGFWNAHEFTVVDTGGIVYDDDEDDVFLPQIREQALIALSEAHVALLVVDGKTGCTVLDEQIASFLRRQGTPCILAVNKCESTVDGELQAADFWTLGLGTPWPVSGLHGTGMGEVLDELVKPLPPPVDRGATSSDVLLSELRVAILGRPNVGKSSLLNRLTGTERAIVCDRSGTTRDAVDQSVINHGTKFTFVDTAGVRKAARVSKGVEELMVRRSLKAARRSDVCLLVVDATEGVSEQENRLARFIVESGRACVVIVNKWDLVPNKDDMLYRNSGKYLEGRLPTIQWAKALYVSAKTGLRTNDVFKAVRAAAEQHQRRVTTAIMNEVLEDGVRWQKPPSTSTGRQGAIYYCAQVTASPPTIAIFCNDPELFSDTYRRYLERHFRKSLGFDGTPLRLLFRGRSRRDPGAD